MTPVGENQRSLLMITTRASQFAFIICIKHQMANGCGRLCRHLPLADGIKGVGEHEDVQQQTVAYPPNADEFEHDE